MNTNVIDPGIDGRGRINTWAFCNIPFDDRVSLFEHKPLDNVKVSVEARPNLNRSYLKCVQRNLTALASTQ